MVKFVVSCLFGLYFDFDFIWNVFSLLPPSVTMESLIYIKYSIYRKQNLYKIKYLQNILNKFGQHLQQTRPKGCFTMGPRCLCGFYFCLMSTTHDWQKSCCFNDELQIFKFPTFLEMFTKCCIDMKTCKWSKLSKFLWFVQFACSFSRNKHFCGNISKFKAKVKFANKFLKGTTWIFKKITTFTYI